VYLTASSGFSTLGSQHFGEVAQAVILLLLKWSSELAHRVNIFPQKKNELWAGEKKAGVEQCTL